jgi:hypothetical protein
MSVLRLLLSRQLPGEGLFLSSSSHKEFAARHFRLLPGAFSATAPPSDKATADSGGIDQLRNRFGLRKSVNNVARAKPGADVEVEKRQRICIIYQKYLCVLKVTSE